MILMPDQQLSQHAISLFDLQTPVISMVIVGFVQSVAISKRFAYKHGYEIDSSQELISLGMANLLGGMFQSYPVTGAIGQSAVNDDIGAETGVASVVTGLVVMIVLLFLTFVFENMPLCVLAAIVISFVLSMFVSVFVQRMSLIGCSWCRTITRVILPIISGLQRGYISLQSSQVRFHRMGSSIPCNHVSWRGIRFVDFRGSVTSHCHLRVGLPSHSCARATAGDIAVPQYQAISRRGTVRRTGHCPH
jgi:hypothetical protein